MNEAEKIVIKRIAMVTDAEREARLATMSNEELDAVCLILIGAFRKLALPGRLYAVAQALQEKGSDGVTEADRGIYAMILREAANELEQVNE